MDLHNLLQTVVLITGAIAIAITQFAPSGARWQRWAAPIGLAGQPVWLWDFWHAEPFRFGMFALTLWYTGVWAGGVWRWWIWPAYRRWAEREPAPRESSGVFMYNRGVFVPRDCEHEPCPWPQCGCWLPPDQPSQAASFINDEPLPCRCVGACQYTPCRFQRWGD